MPGARCTRGLVCKSVQKGAHEHTGSAEASDIPCAMVLRLISCSPRSGRARCHRRRWNGFHQLDASIGVSGPHDFAVRFRAIRQRHIHVHRIPSRACDDRETPLVPGRDQIDILLIWVSRQVNFGKSEICRSVEGAQYPRLAGFLSVLTVSAVYYSLILALTAISPRRLRSLAMKAAKSPTDPPAGSMPLRDSFSTTSGVFSAACKIGRAHV